MFAACLFGLFKLNLHPKPGGLVILEATGIKTNVTYLKLGIFCDIHQMLLFKLFELVIYAFVFPIGFQKLEGY